MKIGIKATRVTIETIGPNGKVQQSVTRWCQTVDELLAFADRNAYCMAWEEARSALDSGDALLLKVGQSDADQLALFWQESVEL
jgi:hypothetical protein